MMREQTDLFANYPSRREVLQGLAIALLPVSLAGCAQALSSSSAIVPTPTPHRPGSPLLIYRRHTDRVTDVAWSPDGKYIASSSLDRTVQVWSANPTEQTQPFVYRDHTAGVRTVDWAPGSQRVVSGAEDQTVQAWDALTGEHVVSYRGHTNNVTAVAWSPDGNTIASGSADSTVRTWDVGTGKQKNVYRGHSADITSLVWSPDSQRIASAALDKTVQIQDAATGSQLYTYRGHTDQVSSVSWSPDGKFIVSGSWDKTVQVWHATTGALLYTYSGYNVKAAETNPAKGVLPDLIFVVAWSHNGKRIAAVTQVYCGDLCAVVLGWDAYTQRNFTFYTDTPVFAIAWSPDDTRLVTSTVVSTQGFPRGAPQDGAYAQIVWA
jgi:WD40 repeat protein